jgi:hypothetical protein
MLGQQMVGLKGFEPSRRLFKPSTGISVQRVCQVSPQSERTRQIRECQGKPVHSLWAGLWHRFSSITLKHSTRRKDGGSRGTRTPTRFIAEASFSRREAYPVSRTLPKNGGDSRSRTCIPISHGTTVFGTVDTANLPMSPNRLLTDNLATG